MGFFGTSFSLSSATGFTASRTSSLTNNDMDGTDLSPQRPSRILSLPPEIIQQIFSYLSAEHLSSVHRTCRDLQTHATEDKLWSDLLRLEIPGHDFPTTAAPFSSFRDLYLAHHPNWFLPRQKIWFSDDVYTGKLILIKFNPQRGSIEGYRLAAERPPAIPEIWSYKPDVLIHHLNPHIYVSTNDPVLALSPQIATLPFQSSSSSRTPSTEIRMRVGAPTQKIDASLLLSIDLPEPTASTPSVSVWPPRIIPSMPRTRSSSSSGATDRFSSQKHKPQTLREISQTTFRLRAWSNFTQGILNLGSRVGEAVSTWSTLSPDLYTPTPHKPYQGIFVGDYAAHGCEFLLVLQSAVSPISARRMAAQDHTRARPSRYLSAILAALSDDTPVNPDGGDLPTPPPDIDTKELQNQTNSQINVVPNVPDPDGQIHQGAIEAIKLTGDVNVPRGEHTFVADDIGPTGTIRIAAEKPFRGARVVKSRGHVAGRGFQDDEFIPSQLFLINPNLLAQYWLPFGHISFYRRIDIDDLLEKAGWDARRVSG